jgi:organic hydroperoxide reductase OsmC/OhrA
MNVRPKDDHTCALALRWEGNRGEGTSNYQAYGRNYRIHLDGRPDLFGSADPTFRGDPALYNPEDLLLAALSACHMLSYLALCARRGVVVLDYSDEAEGVLTFTITGGGHFTSVILRPKVRVAAQEQAALAQELHAKAHEDCFIAASCNFPVHHEAVVTWE